MEYTNNAEIDNNPDLFFSVTTTVQQAVDRIVPARLEYAECDVQMIGDGQYMPLDTFLGMYATDKAVLITIGDNDEGFVTDDFETYVIDYPEADDDPTDSDLDFEEYGEGLYFSDAYLDSHSDADQGL